MTIRLLCFLIAVLVAKAATANDEVEGTVDRLMSAMDVILERHIEPPTRQEMVLAVARALHRAGPERRTSRAVSQLAGRDALRGFLVETWRKNRNALANESHEVLSHRIMAAMLRPVAAESGLPHQVLSDEAYMLNRQFADNRYIGIGIRLTSSLSSRLGYYPSVASLIEDGPADRAGMKSGDLMVAINGQDMKEVNMQEVIKLLRGQEGELVTIEVRQPIESEESTRTLVFKRGVAPFKTMSFSHHVDEEGKNGILHLGIQSITGSTLHELRKAETSGHGADAKGVVLDLRTLGNADRHHTVTLANGLLNGGTIGELIGVDGVRRFEADRECLFRGLPMAVLVGSGTSGVSEWLAAALQDNQRAVIVGVRTAGQNYISEPVPLPDGGAIVLATHRWKRSVEPKPDSRRFERQAGRLVAPLSWDRGVWPDVVTVVSNEDSRRFASDRAKRLFPHAFDDSLKRAIDYLRERVEADERSERGE